MHGISSGAHEAKLVLALESPNQVFSKKLRRRGNATVVSPQDLLKAVVIVESIVNEQMSLMQTLMDQQHEQLINQMTKNAEEVHAMMIENNRSMMDSMIQMLLAAHCTSIPSATPPPLISRASSATGVTARTLRNWERMD